MSSHATYVISVTAKPSWSGERVLICRVSCRQTAAAERISKLSLPGKRVELKTLDLYAGIGSILALLSRGAEALVNDEQLERISSL